MKTAATALGILTLATILTGCGATAGGQPSPSSSPTPSPSPSPTGIYPNARVLVDPSGNLTLKAGDQVVIVLSKQTGFELWGRVSSDGLDIMAPLYPPVASSTESSKTALTALGPGHTTLRSSTTPECRPPSPLPSGQGYACPAIARVWSLEVTVSAGPRDPASTEFPFPSGFRSIHVLVGDQLTLSPGLTDAHISPPGPVQSRGRNPDGSQTLVAVGPGTAEVAATTDAPCLHAVPACMIAVMELRLQVVVSPK